LKPPIANEANKFMIKKQISWNHTEF